MIHAISGPIAYLNQTNPGNWGFSETDLSEIICKDVKYLEGLKNLSYDLYTIQLVASKLIGALNILIAQYENTNERKLCILTAVLNVVTFLTQQLLTNGIEKLAFVTDEQIITTFSFCVDRDNYECAEMLLSWREFISPSQFLYAIKLRDVSRLKQQMIYYSDPYFTFSNGESPLHLAVKYHFAQAIPLLLKKGYFVSQLNQEGKTALECLTENGANSAHELLLEAFVDGNYDFTRPDFKGNTLYHYAALHRRPNVISWAKNRKIPINNLNTQGLLPLDIAILKGSDPRTETSKYTPEVITRLVEQDAKTGSDECLSLLWKKNAYTRIEIEKIIEQLLKISWEKELLKNLRIPSPILKNYDVQVRPERLQLEIVFLLQGKGFEGEFNSSQRHECYGYLEEAQGSQDLRKRVRFLNPMIFYPPALTRFKEVNPPLYKVFLIKRFAHALALSDTILKVGSQKIGYEAFSESFTLPMLASTIKVMEPKKNLSREDLDWIFETLKTAQIVDRMDETDYVRLSHQLQESNYKETVLCGSGYDWHFPGWIVYGDFIIYCNRGSKKTYYRDEITVYFLEKSQRKKMTPDILKKIINRFQSTSSNYFTQKNIEEFFHLCQIFSYKMKRQTAGNCTYATSKALIFVLMTIRYLMINHPGKIHFDTAKKVWGQAFRHQIRSYKTFTKTDRTIVVSHLIHETDEFLKNPSSIEDGKLYYSLLRSAVASFTKRKMLSPKYSIKRLDYEYRFVLWDRLVRIFPHIKSSLPIHF